MQILPKLAISGALAVNVAVAGTAAATTYTETYTGIVEGTDTDGLFGTPGNSLNGVSFTAIFTYNPSLFGTASSDMVAGAFDVVQGGSSNLTTSPILSDSLTINGISLSVDPSQAGLLLAANESDIAELADEVEDSVNDRGLTAGVVDPSLSIVPDLTATQSYSGFLAYEEANGEPGELLYGGDDLDLYSNTADISASSAPEPGSLALMATAVGLLGFAARRRPA